MRMRELGKMTPEERKVAGPTLNALKDELNSALNAKKTALADAVLNARLETEWLDVTLPSRSITLALFIQFPRSQRRLLQFLPIWAFPLLKDQELRRIGIILMHSTSPVIIRQEPKWTLSI